jgi:hypothetical protein
MSYFLAVAAFPPVYTVCVALLRRFMASAAADSPFCGSGSVFALVSSGVDDPLGASVSLPAVDDAPAAVFASRMDFNGWTQTMDKIETTSRGDAHDVECVRCHLKLAVGAADQSVTFSYDIEQWRSRCCCGHLEGPVSCCSFLELEGIINDLSRSCGRRIGRRDL